MNKSFLHNENVPHIGNKDPRFSADLSSQYTQIASFLNSFLQNVQENGRKSLPKSRSRQHLNVKDNVELKDSRRRSSFLQKLKMPLNFILPKPKPRSKFSITPKQKKEIEIVQASAEIQEKERPKIVYKRFNSSVSLDTNSQELFSRNPGDIKKKEISSKTLKVNYKMYLHYYIIIDSKMFESSSKMYQILLLCTLIFNGRQD